MKRRTIKLSAKESTVTHEEAFAAFGRVRVANGRIFISEGSGVTHLKPLASKGRSRVPHLKRSASKETIVFKTAKRKD